VNQRPLSLPQLRDGLSRRSRNGSILLLVHPSFVLVFVIVLVVRCGSLEVVLLIFSSRRRLWRHIEEVRAGRRDHDRPGSNER
jgi:hypothetical protein